LFYINLYCTMIQCMNNSIEKFDAFYSFYNKTFSCIGYSPDRQSDKQMKKLKQTNKREEKTDAAQVIKKEENK